MKKDIIPSGDVHSRKFDMVQNYVAAVSVWRSGTEKTIYWYTVPKRQTYA
jgi:hypothetical protein